MARRPSSLVGRFPKVPLGLGLEPQTGTYFSLANIAYDGGVADELERPRCGRALATDATASSASDSLPGFLAKPHGAPVYHGFRVLADIVVDGFTLGAITDFEAELTTEGDSFVIAPDNSRAGLVWEVSSQQSFERICDETDERWGVWAVSFPFPMTSRENARANLAAIVPLLKPKWEAWRHHREMTDKRDQV